MTTPRCPVRLCRLRTAQLQGAVTAVADLCVRYRRALADGGVRRLGMHSLFRVCTASPGRLSLGCFPWSSWRHSGLALTVGSTVVFRQQPSFTSDPKRGDCLAPALLSLLTATTLPLDQTAMVIPCITTADACTTCPIHSHTRHVHCLPHACIHMKCWCCHSKLHEDNSSPNGLCETSTGLWEGGPPSEKHSADTTLAAVFSSLS